MDNKIKLQKIVLLILFLGLSCFAFADSISFPTYFEYSVEGIDNGRAYSCESIVIDSTVSKFGFSSFRCHVDNELLLLSLSEKISSDYKLNFKNAIAMYISFSFKRNLFGEQNIREAKYGISFSFFGMGKYEEQEELALKLINWFEEIWLKDLKWEKKIRDIN